MPGPEIKNPEMGEPHRFLINQSYISRSKLNYILYIVKIAIIRKPCSKRSKLRPLSSFSDEV